MANGFFGKLSDKMRSFLDSRGGEKTVEEVHTHVLKLTPNAEQAAEITFAALLQELDTFERGELPENDSDTFCKLLISRADNLLNPPSPAKASRPPEPQPEFPDQKTEALLNQRWTETQVRRNYMIRFKCTSDHHEIESHLHYLLFTKPDAWLAANDPEWIWSWMRKVICNLSHNEYRRIVRVERGLHFVYDTIQAELAHDSRHLIQFEDVEPHLKECTPHEQEVISKLANDKPSVVAKGYGVARSTIWRIRSNVRERITAGMRQKELFRHID